MKNWPGCVCVLLIATVTFLSAGEGRVHKCSSAGRWFPSDRDDLQRTVEMCLKRAREDKSPGRVRAIVVPHAHIKYSGEVAAYAFKTLKGQGLKRAVVLAGHRSRQHVLSVDTAAHYETPLGKIPVDVDACKQLRAAAPFSYSARTHYGEHALENQLPFLQVVLADFKLVPIILRTVHREDYEKAAAALRKLLDKDTVLVVSCDFTHYGAYFDYTPFRTDILANLNKLDHEAFDLIVKKDFDGFMGFLSRSKCTICGERPVGILLKLAGPTWTGKVLKYDTSARMEGRAKPSTSVSYAAIVFREAATGEEP